LPLIKPAKGYATLRPGGKLSFAGMARLMHQAVVRCRRRKIPRLLIDSTGLPDLSPPSLAGRFELAARIATAAGGAVKIAHVASPAWNRDGKFSTVVARNRGLTARSFRTERAALRWLLAGPPPPPAGARPKTGVGPGVRPPQAPVSTPARKIPAPGQSPPVPGGLPISAPAFGSRPAAPNP